MRHFWDEIETKFYAKFANAETLQKGHTFQLFVFGNLKIVIFYSIFKEVGHFNVVLRLAFGILHLKSAVQAELENIIKTFIMYFYFNINHLNIQQHFKKVT
ncbi:Hypothetical_protein [Hexamita inflata]|uniref:Hypothetical_protein n=1 Tax=Hexamita inflata TaxID=28002 RepID=A0AA86UKB1_9EUKA|nr:Hypothetical protein HINF_LOCUS30603 [Hexamita inflata]